MPRYSVSNGFHYTTESLGEYTRDVRNSIHYLCKDMTHHMGEKLEDAVKSFTPEETGRLKESIKAGLVYDARSKGFLGSGGFGTYKYIVKPEYEVSVETDLDYAPAIEYGSGLKGLRGAKYEIKARNGRALRFFWTKIGKEVRFARVMHPGVQPQRMFAKGAAYAGREAYVIKETKPYLKAWRAQHAVARQAT